jgi:RNA polymerase sigma-70 factor (family 1)
MKEDELLTTTEILALLKQVATGDQKAFRQLFNYFSSPIKGFAYAIVKTNDAATEILDEIFIKIWRNKEKVAEIQNFKVYLYTAAKNTALNYLAKKAHAHITEPFDHINIEIKESQSPEQLLISKETYQKINDAIKALPPRCKMIFKLVREDGLKYKEVAEVLNISPKTVDAQMVIAIKKIAEKVGHQLELKSNPTKKINIFLFLLG